MVQGYWPSVSMLIRALLLNLSFRGTQCRGNFGGAVDELEIVSLYSQ